MSSLDYAEKIILEQIFGMGSGYVLSLSNKDFAELFNSVLKIDIYSDEYADKGNSKASRMRSFWDKHADSEISKIISTIGRVFMEGKPNLEADFKKLNKIIDRLNKYKTSIEVNEKELESIWEKGKARIFISHRDSQKKIAASISEKLSALGISGFVAHESISPNSKWRDELRKGLQTMDSFLILLSKDYFSSVWTNQEIGYAIARNVPIFIYSIDGTSPDGFLMDIQAAKGTEDVAIAEVRRGLQSHPAIRANALEVFADAINGSFHHAKIKFIELLDFEFNDEEIEFIVSCFMLKATYTNQLLCLLSDPILKEHLNVRALKGLKLYHEALWSLILSRHSRKRYKLVKGKHRMDISDTDSKEG